MRVVSWNVKRGREPGFRAGVEAVVALQPDIVLLQEVGRPPAAPQPDELGPDQLGPDQFGAGELGPDELFAARLGGWTTYFPTIRDAERGDYGLAIVSRLPVTASGSAAVFVPAGLEPRLAGWVVTDLLAVATVHLSHEPKGLAPNQVGAALDSLPDEVTLVAGDLNCRPRRRYGRWRRLPNNGWRTSRTFPAGRPRRALDHVLTTHPSRVTATRVLRISGSDHLPILVEWRPTSSTVPRPTPRRDSPPRP
ncbi:MAG: endonuclease/exonuclease/phosphatase family protein [Actinomycetota bacterium]|nr:endonuclease/exonuclease/phosphatase family protein [Actinomycetota bacterium]